jgi:hypothetical protein
VLGSKAAKRHERTEPMSGCGYLYVACGDPKFACEASRSAASLRRVTPDAHVTLIADRPLDQDVFDDVLVRPADGAGWREGLSYKVRHLYASSPYERTFFVDSDTYFYEDCTPLFDILRYFDLCVASAPFDLHEPVVEGRPLRGYTPYNSGVIVFRRGAVNQQLFTDWFDIFQAKLSSGVLERTGESDQTAFMEALLHRPARAYVLPAVWNARIPFYLPLRGFVKIVHGRHEDYEALRGRINSTDQARVWDPVMQRCLYHDPRRRRSRISKLLARVRGR